MKKNYFILVAIVLSFYSTSWAQTSYGNLIQGNAGTGGDDSNSFFGYQAGLNTTVNYNTFIGYQSGLTNIDGVYNTFLGVESGEENISGQRNTFLGYRSGRLNTLGSHNGFLGYSSGINNDTGSSNTFLGAYSGLSNTIGNNNTFLGRSSGYSNIDGNNNSFVGYESGFNNAAGGFNVFMGYRSGYENTIGSTNTYLGYRSGFNNQIGSGNVFLGYQAGYFETGSNLLYIDNSDTSSPLIWGDFANDIINFNGTIGIGLDPDNSNPPTQALDVQGTARLRDIPQNSILDRVLVTDTDGNISWRESSTIGVSHSFPSYPESAGDGGGNTNSYFGDEAGLNSTGIWNTFIGHQSGYNNASSANTATGTFSLYTNTTGRSNTANGASALAFNDTGDWNTAVGDHTLFNNSTGNSNTANGYQVLFNNNGHNNTASGYRALINNTTGNENIAIGTNASVANTIGNGNTAIGYAAGSIAINNLENTTAVGSSAIVSADDATAVGSGAQASGANAMALGHNAFVNAPDEVRIGNAAITSIGGAVNWSVISDGRFKTAVKEDIPGLEFITQLRPVSYQLEREKLQAFLKGDNIEGHAKTPSGSSQRTTGFVAQEVIEVIDKNGYEFSGIERPQNENDHYSIRYSEFVVPLTKAVQELSALVEAQQQKIAQLENMVYGTGATSSPASTVGLKGETTLPEGFVLEQNIPNPFHRVTTISAMLPESVQKAKIIIYNLQGLELESYPLTGRGNTSVEISGGHFPSGMYLYTLIADDRIIDTKKMILTR